MALKAGRPSETRAEDQPRQFTQTYTDEEGYSQTWHYDLDKSPNGPMMVEIFYPDGYFPEEQEENLPKTKRKYFNPANGKMVAYARAKELGLL
jgi:hypothetical protein